MIDFKYRHCFKYGVRSGKVFIGMHDTKDLKLNTESIDSSRKKPHQGIKTIIVGKFSHK